MNRRMPPVAESSEWLKERMNREGHALKRQRLHALYLIASRQAKTRTAIGQVLGVSRFTVGEWLALYEAGGVKGLLEVRTPPGKRPTLNADQQARLHEALADPQGFASYKEVQAWIARELGVEMRYDAVRKLVRYRLGAKLKIPRRSHIKKPG